MNRRGSECKDNNAAPVKIKMPESIPAVGSDAVGLTPLAPINTASRRQKKLDIAFDMSIIIFTYLPSDLRGAHGQARYQAPNTPTTGNLEPAVQRCPRRTLSPERILRPSRLGPGQVREAAPSRDRRPVGDGGGSPFRFFATVLLSGPVRFGARGLGRLGSPQARSQAGPPTHRGGYDFHPREAPERTFGSASGTGAADPGTLRYDGASAKYRAPLTAPSKKRR